MNEFERRIRRLVSSLTEWWGKRRSAGTGDLRRQATAQAQRAASKLNDLRDTDAAKRAASKLNDLRDTDAAKRAASKLNDLRDSDTGKRAASALSDLRQREAVRKAEESAKRALHDLRSGRGNGSSTS